MPYTYLTFSQLKALLSERLSDPAQTFWTNPEVGTYIQISLRLWNSLTSYYRSRYESTLPTGLRFPDLTNTTQFTGAPLQFTLLDQNLINWMEYFLMEPQTTIWDGTWHGTEMFSLSSLTDALEKRLNQFLFETSSIIGEPFQITASSSVPRYPLPDNIMDITRCEWQPFGGHTSPIAHFPLEKSDPLELQNLLPIYSFSPQQPQTYTLYPTPLLTVQLSPTPNDLAFIDILPILSHPPLNSINSGTLLHLFQDLLPYVMLGALSTLLSQAGPSYDPQRAEYLEQRWQEGLSLVKERLFTSIFYAELEGVPIPLRSIYDLDMLTPNWTLPTGQPTALGLAGLNRLCVSPAPDFLHTTSLILDYVQPAPVPVANEDLIQLGREEIDSLLGEAEHLALFKRGGQEFLSSLPLHQGFLRMAMNYNDRLRAEAKSFTLLQQQPYTEEVDRPRRVSKGQ